MGHWVFGLVGLLGNVWVGLLRFFFYNKIKIMNHLIYITTFNLNLKTLKKRSSKTILNFTVPLKMSKAFLIFLAHKTIY